MPLCCALIFIGVSGPSLGERRLKIGATHPSSGTRDLPGACGLGQVKARGGGEGLHFFSLAGETIHLQGSQCSVPDWASPELLTH